VMARKNENRTPTFVLNLELTVEPFQVYLLEKQFEISRQLYNTILGELLKRHEQLKRTKKHQRLSCQLRAVTRQSLKYENATSKEGKEKLVFYLKEHKQILTQIIEMQREYGLTEYQTHEWVKEPRNHYTFTSKNKVQLHSALAQKVASRSWTTFEKLLKGKAKQVHFKQKGELTSLEGKQAHTGIVFNKETGICSFGNLSMPVMMKEKDDYVTEALQSRIKYSRITKETIRGKDRYFLQLAMEGMAPPKRDKNTGQFKYPIGDERVGIDLGTQSVAVVSKERIILTDLAPDVQILWREIRRIQRKMDRSKRATNPQNYKEDGTIKKGRRTWVYSNHYLKLKAQLKELYRKLRVKRLLSHRRMANHLLSYGNEFYIEQMNIQALQKRAKETKINEKTGKYQRKKRFGKSIANKSPATFKNTLKEKVLRLGGQFYEVNTRTFKASQYDHKKDEYIKKKLSHRWHIFEDGTKVQRDLYSAFLLMNSNEDLKTSNTSLCIDGFKAFLIKHDIEINRIKETGIKVKNSGIH
jgi:hypothetical protein